MNILKHIGNPEKEIKIAWIAGCIVAGATALAGLLGVLGRWYIVDVIISLALAFGTYRRSRTCAVAMFLYFIANRVVAVAHLHKPPGTEAYFLGIAFLLGIHGTFDCQARRRGARAKMEVEGRYAPPANEVQSMGRERARE